MRAKTAALCPGNRSGFARLLISISLIVFCSGATDDDGKSLGEGCRTILAQVDAGHPGRASLEDLAGALDMLVSSERPPAAMILDIDRRLAETRSLFAGSPPETDIMALESAWIDFCRRALPDELAALKASAAGLFSSLAESPARAATAEAEQIWRAAGRLTAEVPGTARVETGLTLARFAESFDRLSIFITELPPGIPAHGAFQRCRAAWERSRALASIAERQSRTIAGEAPNSGGSNGNRPPRGVLQHCRPGSISGWVWDPDDPGKPLAVILRVNGSFAAAGTANLPVYGIAELAGAPSHLHGFLFERFDFPPGDNTIEIFALDTADGSETRIGAGTIVMPESR